MEALSSERRPSAARQKRAVEMSQRRGIVVGVEPGSVVVDTGDETHEARRAVSCLVEPVVGDLVLVAAGDDARCHVLAVLEREAGSPTHLAFDGDVTVKVREGRFTVGAPAGITFATSKETAIVSGSVSITAAEGSVVLSRLAYVGQVVHAEVERVKHAGLVLESVLERISQRVKRSFRVVGEIDSLRAEQIDYAAKQTVHLHGQHALVTARELVKLDGEHIHLG